MGIVCPPTMNPNKDKLHAHVLPGDVDQHLLHHGLQLCLEHQLLPYLPQYLLVKE